MKDEYCFKCRKITPHFDGKSADMTGSCAHCGWITVKDGSFKCGSCSVKTVDSDKRADVKHCAGCDEPEKEEATLEDLLNAQDKLNGMISEKISEKLSERVNPVPTPGHGGDPVFRPEHYTQWLIEPFTFLMLNQVPFAEGSVLKYVMRWRKKNGVEDLRKARRILEMMIEMEEHRGDYIAEKTCL